MASSPISRSPVANPQVLRRASVESVSLPAKGLTDLQGTSRGPDLRRLLSMDGFDAPTTGAKQVGGTEALAQVFARMAQLLTESARLLGGEGAAKGPGLPDTTSKQGAPVQESKAVDTADTASKKGNTLTFTNDGTTPMTIQFTPNAGEKAIDSVTLEPGKKQVVEFPEGWSGNFRNTAGDGKAATLGEVKFNGGGNQTYYDVSYIEGNNAAMTMKPVSGGRESGTGENLLASAPESIKARDAHGSVYGIKKTTTSDVQDPAVVDFYRKHVGADQGYVIPKDDLSALGTGDTHLDVHLKNLE
jgi:hypothetical protein